MHATDGPRSVKSLLTLPGFVDWLSCNELLFSIIYIYMAIDLFVPGASMILAELAMEAGLPNGVLNIIHGAHVRFLIPFFFFQNFII